MANVLVRKRLITKKMVFNGIYKKVQLQNILSQVKKKWLKIPKRYQIKFFSFVYFIGEINKMRTKNNLAKL